jgi:hypothetical protein
MNPWALRVNFLRHRVPGDERRADPEELLLAAENIAKLKLQIAK